MKILRFIFFAKKCNKNECLAYSYPWTIVQSLGFKEKGIDDVIWPPDYKVRRHRLVRNVKLTASERKGLLVTIPYHFNVKQIPSIIEDNKSWIAAQLVKMTAAPSKQLPNTIQLLSMNEEWQVYYEQCKAKCQLIERPMQELVLTGDIQDKTKCMTVLRTWLQKKSSDYLIDYFTTLNQSLGFNYQSISIRNQETRWGSCTDKSVINLNVKLIFLPIHLVRYVMIHELCHTKVLNHSLRFWQLVEMHDPNYKEHRKMLRLVKIPNWI